jgi:hypothetical protein
VPAHVFAVGLLYLPSAVIWADGCLGNGLLSESSHANGFEFLKEGGNLWVLSCLREDNVKTDLLEIVNRGLTPSPRVLQFQTLTNIAMNCRVEISGSHGGECEDVYKKCYRFVRSWGHIFLTNYDILTFLIGVKCNFRFVWMFTESAISLNAAATVLSWSHWPRYLTRVWLWAGRALGSNPARSLDICPRYSPLGWLCGHWTCDGPDIHSRILKNVQGFIVLELILNKNKPDVLIVEN